jgi:hypothetical protein
MGSIGGQASSWLVLRFARATWVSVSAAPRLRVKKFLSVSTAMSEGPAARSAGDVDAAGGALAQPGHLSGPPFGRYRSLSENRIFVAISIQQESP